ncbi:MAG: hypothetical protein ACRD2U_01590 [Terriglobales bacterium]
MTVDLFGLKAVNKTGKFFSNTYWLWGPLWDYVANECSDILTKKDIYLGQGNNGHKISRTKATKIGKRMYELLITGKTKAYAKSLRRSGLSKLKSPGLDAVRGVARALGVSGRPQFSVANVKDFADFCVTSGGFEIS